MTNVDTAKVFFGVVLKQLQVAFPAAYFISETDIWPEFECLAKDGQVSLRNKRSYKVIPVSEASDHKEMRQLYTKQMLSWMVAEGYIKPDPLSDFEYDYVLSSKALSVLNLDISEKQGTLGTTLKRLISNAGDKASGQVIAELIDQAFAAAQGIPA